MKSKRKSLSILLCLTMIFSIFTMTFGNVNAKAQTIDVNAKRIQAMHQQAASKEKVDFNRAIAQKYASTGNINDNAVSNKQTINPTDDVRIIVEMSGPSTFEMAKQKGIKLDKSFSLAESVKAQQLPVINKVKGLGSVRHTYQNLINGFSAVVKYKDIDTIKEMQGVKKVTISNVYYLDMNSAIDSTNAATVWRDLGYEGEGTVVAIVDTGIDVNHKDMRLSDPTRAKLNSDKVSAMGGPGHFFTDKVPYGYNFADMNDIVFPKGSEHGMHVAGIVGANGTDEEIAKDPTSAIKGVAPEAQLLAMKVFSNNPETGAGAYSDDIAAAIEDSVKHGADVINMSLGSTAAFVNYDDPEQKAIENATNAGTIVVVSGGNSYYSTYSVPYNYSMDPDTGLVGSPGLFPDTIQVASSENSKIIMQALNYSAGDTNGLIGYTTSDINPVGVLNGEYDIVDCGRGQVSEFAGKDLTGKIALIQRGIIPFVDKKLNAQAAGAIGAIVFNNDGDNTYINMATDSRIHIPGVFISNKDGVTLKNLIASGVKLSFGNKNTQVTNASIGKMSDFSSWGPTPDFAFKPEVTAPGGSIWSTIPDNKYETMSGTSMASPHTAGAMALVTQYLKAQNVQAGKRDFVTLAKDLIINTAKPIIDPATGKSNLPYLTRKQGAGLIKIDQAIKTRAYVTDETGSPTIAKKNVGNTTTFKLKINNFGNEPLTFTPVNNYGVLTNAKAYSGFVMLPTAAVLTGATTTFDQTTITVPANGTSELNVTLNIPAGTSRNIFAEGFITLTSSDEAKNPSIGIPFMTFYGNWDEPRIFDSPMWDYDNTFYGRTTLIDGENYLGYAGEDQYGPIINPSLISFSPDEDGYMDVVMPYMDLMRNASKMKVQVLDSNGTVLRDVSLDNNVRKTYFNGNTGAPTAPKYDYSWAWDGKLFNAKTNSYEKAMDGQYYLRLSGIVDGGTTPNNLDMPVKLDTTAPALNATGQMVDGKHYKITFNSNDSTGIELYGIFTNNDVNPVTIVDGTEKDYTIELSNDINMITVMAQDYAGNLAFKDIVLNNLTFVPVLMSDYEESFGDNSVYTSENNVVFGYSLIESLKPSVDHYNIIKNNEPAINNELNESYQFSNLPDGLHNIVIDAVDKDGKTIAETKLAYIVDTTSPVINVVEPASTVLTKGEKEVTLKINVKDISGYDLYVNGEKIGETWGTAGDGSDTDVDYEYTVKDIPDAGCKVTIEAVDRLGLSSAREVVFTTNFEKPIVNVTAPENDSIVYGKSVPVTGSVSYKNGVNVAVKVNGTDAVVNSDGTFSATAVFDTYGPKKVNIEATAEDGVKSAPVEINLECQAIEIAGDKNFYSNGTTGSAVTIPYVLKDDAITKVNVDVDGGTPIDNGMNTSITISTENMPVGDYMVNFTAIDKDGNIVSVNSAKLSIQKNNPTIVCSTLTNAPILSGTELFIDGYAVIPLKSIVVKTGEPEASIPQNIILDKDNVSFEGTLTGLHEGLNRVEFTLTDLAGNVNKYEYKIYVDMSAPEFNVTDPVGDNVINVNGTTYTVKVNAKDNVAGYRLYANGNQFGYAESESYDGRGTEKSFEYVYNVPGGDSTLVLKAVDLAGHFVQKEIKFHRDFPSEFGITSTTAVFDVNNKADISVGIYPDSSELQAVMNGDYLLKKGTDYVIDSNNVILSKAYLETLPFGITNLRFILGTGEAGKLTNEVNFTINVYDSRSNDATLRSIKINNLQLEGFLPNVYNYVCEVSAAYSGIPQVSVSKTSDNAKVDIVQATAVPGQAVVTVTAENGIQQVYTINFVNDIIVTKVSPDTTYKVGDEAKLTINVKNNSSQKKQATLIMGLFTTNGEMLYYVAGSQWIEPGMDVNLDGMMSIPDALVGAKQCEIRYLVWDSIDGMNPLSHMGKITVER